MSKSKKKPKKDENKPRHYQFSPTTKETYQMKSFTYTSVIRPKGGINYGK